jgi:hypothetical protein
VRVRIDIWNILLVCLIAVVIVFIGFVVYKNVTRETLEDKAAARLERLEQEKQLLFAKWEKRDISPYQMVEEMQRLQGEYTQFGKWVIAELEKDNNKKR